MDDRELTRFAEGLRLMAAAAGVVEHLCGPGGDAGGIGAIHARPRTSCMAGKVRCGISGLGSIKPLAILPDLY